MLKDYWLVAYPMFGVQVLNLASGERKRKTLVPQALMSHFKLYSLVSEVT